MVGKVERFEKHYTASPVIEIDGMFCCCCFDGCVDFFSKMSMFSEVGEKEKGEEEGTKTKLLADQPSKPDAPNQLEKRYVYF